MLKTGISTSIQTHFHKLQWTSIELSIVRSLIISHQLHSGLSTCLNSLFLPSRVSAASRMLSARPSRLGRVFWQVYQHSQRGNVQNDQTIDESPVHALLLVMPLSRHTVRKFNSFHYFSPLFFLLLLQRPVRVWKVCLQQCPLQVPEWFGPFPAYRREAAVHRQTLPELW